MTLAYILTKSNWRKNQSRLTTRSVVCLWIVLSNNLKMIRIFMEKSSSANRLISGWLTSPINKICVIGQTAIHTYSMSHHCIPKNYGLVRLMGRRRPWTVLLPWWSRPARYCEWESLALITEYFWPQLDQMDLEDMWFQQDGVTSHTANVTINLLETKL